MKLLLTYLAIFLGIFSELLIAHPFHDDFTHPHYLSWIISGVIFCAIVGFVSWQRRTLVQEEKKKQHGDGEK